MDPCLQALKQFTSGNKGSSVSGGSQTQLISMAMAEATKLFDKSGGATSGNKQDAVNGAAMTVMKLLVQSKFSGAVGGGNSGGLGSLMSLVSNVLLYSCFPLFRVYFRQNNWYNEGIVCQLEDWQSSAEISSLDRLNFVYS